MCSPTHSSSSRWMRTEPSATTSPNSGFAVTSSAVSTASSYLTSTPLVAWKMPVAKSYYTSPSPAHGLLSHRAGLGLERARQRQPTQGEHEHGAQSCHPARAAKQKDGRLPRRI